MKKLALFLSVFLLADATSFAQPFQVTSTWSTNGTMFYGAIPVRNSAPAGYLLFGQRVASPSQDVITRLSTTGDTVWSKEYSASGGNLHAAAELDNGDFILTGGHGGGYWERINSSGIMLRHSLSMPTVTANDYGYYSLMQLPDTSSVVLGGGDENNLVWHLNTQGTPVLAARYLAPSGSMPHLMRMQRLTDGGFVLAGLDSIGFTTTASNYMLVKLDSNFNVLWSYSYYPGPGQKEIADLKENDNGDLFLLGTDNVQGQGRNFILMKFDAAGTPLWANTYGTTNTDFAEGLGFDDQGRILIAGSISHEPGLVVCNSTGSVAWSASYIVPAFDGHICSVIADSAGYSLTGYWAQQISATVGFCLQVDTVSGTLNCYYIPGTATLLQSLTVTAYPKTITRNNIAVYGGPNGNVGFIAGPGTIGICATNVEQEESTTFAVEVYPNPMNADGGILRLDHVAPSDLKDISLRVFDVRGKVVYTERSLSSNIIPLTGLTTSGMYFFDITTKDGERVASGKFTVSK